MGKFVTRDGKDIKIKAEPMSEELTAFLANTVPRLSYDEILDGELEKKVKGSFSTVNSLEVSLRVDIKNELLSKAIFDAISKPIGG